MRKWRSMKFQLNDLVTVKLSKKGMLIYYKKAQESKEKYIESLKKWNGWQDISCKSLKEYSEIVGYLFERGHSYLTKKTEHLKKDGTLLAPLDEIIEIFGSTLSLDGKLELFQNSTITIDLNSSTRKLFPPEENKMLETISFQDQILLQLTEFGTITLRKNGYQGVINETGEVAITVLDIMRYLNKNIKQCGSIYDVLATRVVSVVSIKEYQKDLTFSKKIS